MTAFWMNERSGVLRPAVEAYLNDQPMTPAQISALRAYLRLWISSPHFVGGTALENLRGSVDRLTSRGMINAWIQLAEKIGIDPL